MIKQMIQYIPQLRKTCLGDKLTIIMFKDLQENVDNTYKRWVLKQKEKFIRKDQVKIIEVKS